MNKVNEKLSRIVLTRETDCAKITVSQDVTEWRWSTVNVAERLVQARGDRGREEVAKAIGVSLSAIAMYETGSRIPRDETKVKLANYYETTVQKLFFDP